MKNCSKDYIKVIRHSWVLMQTWCCESEEQNALARSTLKRCSLRCSDCNCMLF